MKHTVTPQTLGFLTASSKFVVEAVTIMTIRLVCGHQKFKPLFILLSSCAGTLVSYEVSMSELFQNEIY